MQSVSATPASGQLGCRSAKSSVRPSPGVQQGQPPTPEARAPLMCPHRACHQPYSPTSSLGPQHESPSLHPTPVSHASPCPCTQRALLIEGSPSLARFTDPFSSPFVHHTVTAFQCCLKIFHFLVFFHRIVTPSSSCKDSKWLLS